MTSSRMQWREEERVLRVTETSPSSSSSSSFPSWVLNVSNLHFTLQTCILMKLRCDVRCDLEVELLQLSRTTPKTSWVEERRGEHLKLLHRQPTRHISLHPGIRWVTLHLHITVYFSHFYFFILPILCHQPLLELLSSCVWAHSFTLLSDSSSNGPVTVHYYICTCFCPLRQLLRYAEGYFSKTNISLHGHSVCVCWKTSVYIWVTATWFILRLSHFV